MSSNGSSPVRIAIINDFEVVLHGLAGMLRPFRDRVIVVEGSTGQPPFSTVDVVLFDTFSRVPGDGVIPALVSSIGTTKLVVFAWSMHPDAITQTLAQGAAGYVSKELDALQLVEALELVHRGETVTIPGTALADGRHDGDWPGRAARLTAREAETLAYLVRGLTRQELADALHLSVNTVKTNLTSVYRKIGVESRSAAVQWAIENGFAPEPKRLVKREAPG